MKITCGTDIIEIERIKNAIEKEGEKFLNQVYTDKEIEYCESKKMVKYQHYAARFAAKEAIFKAISGYLNNKFELTWKDVEIKNNNKGKPEVCYKTNKLKEITIDISISHCKEYATATAIAIQGGK